MNQRGGVSVKKLEDVFQEIILQTRIDQVSRHPAQSVKLGERPGRKSDGEQRQRH